MTAPTSFGSAFGCSSHDPEIVQAGLKGDLLDVIRLGILDIADIFSSVLKPTDQHKITKGPACVCGVGKRF
jgi:hypothetical protein